ncbi:MAG: hypothetical protein COU68_00085 [Candidatus Pacebacteria bacterium CG10_big_fil_rev_8_21_14_0_10_45_6]|nr:MAG: hypothetical protein COU68_00085 [Candidatus Pacebacteria bacterium CG10_big_fil_rev_8_21_14_0_10_45_6]
MQKDFGIRGDAGENRATDATVCTVTTVPEDLKFFPNPYGSHAYLLYKPFALYINQEPENRTSEILDYRLGLYDKIRGEDFSTAWSDGDFGIRLKNDRRFRGGFFLREIYEAFQKKDVMIFVNNDRKNPFGTKGLMIVIRSHVPEDILEQMEQEWAETIPDTATSPTQSA